MKLFEYLDRVNKMHRIITRHNTGTPEEFARQLGVSRTSLYELIDELRSRGAPIVYSKSAKTFYYSKPFDIAINCSLRALAKNEEKEFSGGAAFFHKILFFRTLGNELSIINHY